MSCLTTAYIRGQQSESSDIDILVEFEDGADLLDLTGRL